VTTCFALIFNLIFTLLPRGTNQNLHLHFPNLFMIIPQPL
jgi:hypothetical protein